MENRNQRIHNDAEWLLSAGLRPTKQRCVLAACIRGKGNRHLTAEGLHAEVLASDANLSLATVYNTLNALTAEGLLREIIVEPGRVYYDTRVEDHPHFYHEDEARLTDAPADSVTFSNLPEPPEGTEIARVDVIVRLRRE